MLKAAAGEVRANHERLSKLDSVGGDGDHGTTMVRAMALIDKTIDQSVSRDLKKLLHDLGWAIMGVDGGAIGPLLGLFFAGMANDSKGDSADAAQLAGMFESGLANLRKQTKAQPGDKTMMDALVPAVEAARVHAAKGDVVSVLNAAAQAAETGAAATTDMMAKFGRARHIREESIGTADPGATSVALIFNGFLKGAQKNA
jgi:phosphoenolpyruvate---glycerone phosphotransferase subunit DhaL